MTNRIQPFTALPATETPSRPQAAAKPQPSAPEQTDSVTLSPAAQTGTTLLAAARGSSGVDQSQISTIKAALANGSYNVSPEDLAQAISTVLSETP